MATKKTAAKKKAAPKKTAAKKKAVTADVEVAPAYTAWTPADMPIGGKSNSTEMLNDHPTEHNHTASAVSDIVDRFADLRLYVPGANSCGIAGDLQVDGKLTVRPGGAAGSPAIGFDGLDGMGIYSSLSGNYMRFGVAGSQRMAIRETLLNVNTDLQVDGDAKFVGQALAHNGTADKPGYSFTSDTNTGIHLEAPDVMELVVGGERAIQVGKSGSSLDGFWAPGVYRIPTTERYNVYVGSVGGKLGRSTASRSALQQIEPVHRAAVESVLELDPIWYRSKCENDNPNLSQYGFAAEDVAAIDPRLATNVEDEDGNLVPDNVDVVAITALLVGVVKDQHEQISDLTARIEALEAAG